MNRAASLGHADARRREHTEVMLCFDRGTVVAQGLRRRGGAATQLLLWDPRTCAYRAPAHRYAELRGALQRDGVRVRDTVGPAAGGRLTMRASELRPYQKQALTAWELAGRRGVVVLPTGAGKTRVALTAVARLGRATLILVPTRVLLSQWVDQIRSLYDGPVGVFGDGTRDLQCVTVCTFESAYRRMDDFGDRFALVVADEAHHFANGVRVEALEMCAAPFRLGLTATPPDQPDAKLRLEGLVGPVACAYGIGDLSGSYLAPFDVVRLYVELDAADRLAYMQARDTYMAVLRQFRRIGGGDWSEFVRVASQSRHGRQALAAFQESRRIVSAARAKSDAVARLLKEHRNERALIFTADNTAAYALSRQLLLPALTCDIGRREREEVLERLRGGQIRAVISARVLNEGVDLPEVALGIVVGGTLGSREHKQRVGRLLRPREGKRALVYELVARDTHEVATANRRQRDLVS